MCGAGTNKLKGGFKTGACQHQCPYGRMSSPKLLPPISVFPVASCLSRRLFPKSAVGSDPGFFQITAFAPGLGACEIFVCPFRMESLFPIALQLS